MYSVFCRSSFDVLKICILSNMHMYSSLLLKSDLKTLIRKTRFVDIANLSCMIVTACSDDVSCIVCNTIEDYKICKFNNYVKGEQHLDLEGHMKAEDMKVENRYCGNVVSLNRISTTALHLEICKSDERQPSYCF